MSDWDAAVVATSSRFQHLHASIGEMLRHRFNEVEPTLEYGIAAYKVPVPDPPDEKTWKGTMPRTHLFVGPAEKKAGITVHVWHPKAPDLLAQNADWLGEAGFQVMVGCLQWNRKAPFPAEAFARLLDAATEASAQ